MPIYFYSTTGPYGCFSNFSRHSFTLDGLRWPTAEHYFQAQKFPGTDYAEKIRLASTPKQAAALGRSRAIPIRPDWEKVKEAIMRRVVLRKFETHADIQDILLSTGDDDLIENSPTDFYWGCGKDGSGLNRLGLILMETRTILRTRSLDQ
jgi:ribA/ribD-fused uncharacterized protein